MADLAFAPQHNMVAYLVKTEGNAEFHQIMDFLTSSSIHHALTNTTNSQTINDEKQIHAIVDGKTVVITESSVRRDLLFTDNNGITCLTNAQIFENLPLIGYEAVQGEDSRNPSESQPTPSPAQPISKSQIPESSSSPQNTQSLRKTLEGTGFSHTRGPNFPDLSLDVEAVHKEGGEGLGSGPRCQETMGGAMTQIRPKGAPIQSSDPPLSTGHTVASREDMMEHAIELMDHVPQTPHDSPLLRGHTPRIKTAQAKEISSLKKRVTKLEQRQSSRISGFHPFRAEVIVKDKGSGEKGGSIAEIVNTVRPDISTARLEVSTAEPETPLTTTTLFDDEDVTIADTLVKMKSQKVKEKGVTFKNVDDSARPIRSITTLQPLPTIDPKDKEFDEEVRTERKRQKEASKAALAKLYDEVQAQIYANHELAVRLTHKEKEKYTVEEKSKLLAEFFEGRKKLLAKERAEAIRSKPPTKTHLRNLMMTYLKHTCRFTHAQLKSRSFEEIQKLHTKEQKWVGSFVLIGSEEDEKRVGSRKKRVASSSSKQKSPKKQKMNDQESIDSDKELKKCLKVVPGDVHVYKLTRLDGSYRHFSTFYRMLEVLDRQDVLDLHKIVMERFPANDPEGYDLILWGDLKTLMKSSEDDEI
nr:hypothetical protein [Tanacetum cinerariifolium]